MNDFDSDGSGEFEWEDRGELAWNEFDWERYLREQDDTIKRYLGFYDALGDRNDRIDAAAEAMGWGRADAGAEDGVEEEESDGFQDDDEFDDEDDIYTLHKNPVFIATKAICLSLRRPWETPNPALDRVPRALALSFVASLHRGEENAVHAIHALDFGDFAMAVSLFKRALAALNDSLAFLNDPGSQRQAAVAGFRADALSRLYDLREIWLRVIRDCRQELDRPVDEENQ